MLELYHKPQQALFIRTDRYCFDIKNGIAPSWCNRTPKGGRITAAHLHHHADIEYIYLLRGRLFAEVGKCAVTMEPGDMLIINPYELHTANFMADDTVEYCFVAFDYSCLSGFSGAMTAPLDALRQGRLHFPSVIRASDCAASLGRIICSIYTNSKAQEDASADLMQLSRLCQLMAQLLSDVGFAELSAQQTPVRDVAFIDKVARYLDQNYMYPISSSEASTQLGYSKSYFCTLFKHCFGMNFSKYLTSYRISRATVLYCNSGLRMSEIAEGVGFSDYSHFSRAFRQQVGISPLMYFRTTGQTPQT